MPRRTTPIYYFADGPRRRGPFTLDEIRQYPLRENTRVWREGLTAWTELRHVPELWAIFAERLVEPPPQVIEYQVPPPPDPRTAALLGEVPQTGFFRDPTQPPPLDAPPDRLAVASVVLGSAALLAWCVPWGIVASALLGASAVACGEVARRRARRERTPGTWAGAGLWLGGLNLGIAAVIGGILLYYASTMPPPRVDPPLATGPVDSSPASPDPAAGDDAGVRDPAAAPDRRP